MKRKTVFAEKPIFRVLAIRLDCAYLSGRRVAWQRMAFEKLQM